MVALQVCNEILDSGSSTRWEDIAGLENAKKLVHEIIVWPMQNPLLFKVDGGLHNYQPYMCVT